MHYSAKTAEYDDEKSSNQNDPKTNRMMEFKMRDKKIGRRKYFNKNYTLFETFRAVL